MYNWIFQYPRNYNMNDYKSIFNNISKFNSAMPETDIKNQHGYLDISVFTADEKPIENALITVFIMDRFNGEAPVQFATTDANGKAPTLTVPTEYFLSGTIGQDYYFTSYNIRIDALGYYSAQTNNVHFYPEIKNMFTYNMHPIPIKIPGVNLEQRVTLPPSKFQ